MLSAAVIDVTRPPRLFENTMDSAEITEDQGWSDVVLCVKSTLNLNYGILGFGFFLIKK